MVQTSTTTQVASAIAWLQAEPAAVALVLETADGFVAVAVDGSWRLAGSQAEAQALADAGVPDPESAVVADEDCPDFDSVLVR